MQSIQGLEEPNVPDRMDWLRHIEELNQPGFEKFVAIIAYVLACE